MPPTTSPSAGVPSKRHTESTILSTDFEPVSGVRFRDHSPVMVIGHGSSGTSILVELLRDYFQIAFGTESQFVVNYYRKLARYGDLRNDASLRRLLNHITQERWFSRSRRFGFATDAESLMERVEQRTYRGVLDAIFGEFARQTGRARWGDKTPGYVHDLEVLGGLYPDAKYVHVVRDGRDVALSTMSRYFGPNNIFLAAHAWRDVIEKSDHFVRRLDSDQVIEIRYEALLSEPVATCQRLVRFLDVEDRDGTVMSRINDGVPRDVNRNNYNKWKTRLSNKQVQQFDSIACEQLIRHGYESAVSVPRGSASSLESGYWWCDDRVRRWSNAEYWSDNRYKAGQKWKTLLRRIGG